MNAEQHQVHADNVKWMHWLIDTYSVVEGYSEKHGVSIGHAVNLLSQHPDIHDPMTPHYCVHAAQNQALIWDRIHTRCQCLDEILVDTLM